MASEERAGTHDPLAWLTVALAGACVLAGGRALLTLRLQLPLNFNEGWNAYHTADLAAGRALYPDLRGMFFNNYPPLSFLVIAPLGRVLGDQMLAGRAIAMASLTAWIALVAVAARRLRCSWTHAMFGAVVLAIYVFVFSDFYVGVNDPQLLGHAVQMLGLVILLDARKTTASLVAAAALFTAGVFVKNNLVALPLAAALWLFVTDRSRGWRLIVFGAVAGVIAAVVCVAAFGPRFAAQVLSPRGYVPVKAALMGWQWVRRMILPLAVVGGLTSQGPRDREAAFGVTYVAVSLVLGVLFAGGEGVYWNAMFDADCALALTAALATSRMFAARSRTARMAVPLAYLAVPAAVVALGASIHWLSPRFWLDPRWSEAATAAADIEFVRERGGPALCEDLSICYWAGKPVEVDVFNVRQRSRHEWWRIEAILRRIDSREFAVAEIQPDAGRSLGPQFTEALREHYRVDHVDQWGEFWVPREDVR